ncbi:MAG TPA: hypothetical protein VFL27_13330 [Candidatus Dormibacteraeota bacterium]|nr:hypothetical protein [Candidatus Dormibacteraeota bacterium]
MTLADALAERVRSLARTNERLHAIDDATAGHVVQEADADAVLKQALAVLQTRDGLDAARRLLGGEDLSDPDQLAKAGLAVWDPASGAVRPSFLLVELMKVVEQ